ncbi:hypothetical protein MTBPR1_120078 [Candidatus Terasakiella magnetica]|uniref:Uncharacterized protein n=1 Tax=Candidatus Terasakiella magnetica TaxID=1867952 RepID=A0A1C3REW3_9PROT|nr:hypothetical protein [Candidatus Terasakiella magnetica]SCA55772.1 hypothetical protein MTBPR1_120078 [Candidatus Terasakiella magnetica]
MTAMKIDPKIKTRNALMEKLYEVISSRLSTISDYETACHSLTTLLPKHAQITSDEQATEITIHIGDAILCQIQLYPSEENSYYLCLTPPETDEQLKEQIAATTHLISTLE